MKQANFDVTHELDEFLMVERPLQHTKRKANPDLDKMKPELRQLQEEYVRSFCPIIGKYLTIAPRFTVYDFSSSKRMSYYPHNQPIVTLGRDSDDDPTTVMHTPTGSLVPTATIVERSLAGTPDPGPGHQHRATPPLPKDSGDFRRS
jgi:serine/threonine kinase 32